MVAGRKVVATAGTTEGASFIRLWDPVNGKVVREWPATAGGAKKLVFTGDGRTIVSETSTAVCVWDVQTGGLVRQVGEPIGGGVGVAVSSDGKILGGMEYSSPVVVKDVARGRILGRCAGGERWYGFALSPDGKTLATAGGKGLLLWALPREDREDD